MEMSLVGEISPVLDLVHAFKQQFLIFKQYYIYFYTFFFPYVFLKDNNNFTLNVNQPLIWIKKKKKI